MMKHDGPETRITYASLRVRGEGLDPDQVTRIMHVVPTTAHRKGDRSPPRGRAGEIVARSGVWLLSTEDLVASANLAHHIAHILGVLVPGRQDVGPLVKLHALLAHNRGLKADIALFWHGRAGAKRPSVPRVLSEVAKLIPATIETDFDTDEEEPEQRRYA